MRKTMLRDNVSGRIGSGEGNPRLVTNIGSAVVR